MPATKIATCTYCGTRAALVLTGRTQHELACSACGAPLHDLKMLRADAVDPDVHRAPRPKTRGKTKARQSPVERVGATPLGLWETAARSTVKRVKKKKRKSLSRRLFEEAFDVLEDIFD